MRGGGGGGDLVGGKVGVLTFFIFAIPGVTQMQRRNPHFMWSSLAYILAAIGTLPTLERIRGGIGYYFDLGIYL